MIFYRRQTANYTQALLYGAAATVALSGAIVVPDQPGLEFTIPENRMHYTMPVNRMHHTVPENRMHHTIPEED